LVSAQTSIGTVQYKYNALGQRVSKTTPTSTTVFHYDQTGQLIGEKNGTNTIDYIYLNTIPVAIGKSSTPQIYYINTDQLNTPRVITNETGTTLWQWDGEAFGNTPPNENPSGAGNFTFNLRFPGQHFDAETNLNQNYFRDYDPATGRYIESDPIGLAGGISTYGYVGANPLSNFDSTGLQAIPMPPPLVPILGGGSFSPGSGGGYNPAMDIYTPAPPNFLNQISLILAAANVSIDQFFDQIKNACSEDISREECKKDCISQYERDTEECSAYYKVFGKRKYSECMARAGEYLGQCTQKCDGK
jgi:RHS repeat-associated protein